MNPLLVAISFVALASTNAHGQMFESDSKRFGNPKMDIVLKEVERRERSSVIDIEISKVGSSVGSSFFIVCSLRQLAQLRGAYRYVVKLEKTPKSGQMLVGFLRHPSDNPADVGPEFANLAGKDIVDLNQFAQICGAFG
jgi:hypothetical protein